MIRALPSLSVMMWGRALLGIIAISVVMFFVALATDIFWIGKVAMGIRKIFE